MRLNNSDDSAHSGYLVWLKPLEPSRQMLAAGCDLGFLLAHHVLAAVVTALGAYSVINMPCSTVRALSDGRSHSHIVGAALCGTSLRLSSFRMCHFLVLFKNYCSFSFLSASQRGSVPFVSLCVMSSLSGTDSTRWLSRALSMSGLQSSSFS